MWEGIYVYTVKVEITVGMNVGAQTPELPSQGIRSPPHLPVWVWRPAASVGVESGCFIPHSDALPFEPGTVPGFLALDLCSTVPELAINQELRPSLKW